MEYPTVAWESLHALVTTAAGDLWAAGDYGVLLHAAKGGEKWSRMASPATTHLRAAAVAGERVFFVGDQGTVVRRDGDNFTVDTLEPKADLHSVWAASENDAWAVGTSSDAGDAGGASAIWHFDGTRWSTYANAPADRIESVHGSGPNDVWMAGARGVYHLVDGVFQTVLASPKVDARIWVRSPQEVFLSSRDRGPSEWGPRIERFDGTNWTKEVLGVRLRVDVPIGRFVTAPDGALWAVATSLLRREANGIWQAPADVQPSSESQVVEALTFREGEPFVAGEKGLLFRAKDPAFHEGLTGGFRYAKAFPAGSILQAGNAMLTYDTQGFHRIRTAERPGLWVSANAWNDAFFVVSGGGGSRYDSYISVERYDGTQFRTLQTGAGPSDNYSPLALASNGDLYLSYRSTAIPAPYPTQLKKLAASSSKPTPTGCGYGWPLWTIGPEILYHPESGGPNRRVKPDGQCEDVPFGWSDASGPNYQNVYTVAKGDGATIFGHFDGTQWKELARPEGNYCGVFYLGDNDVWLKSCGGPRHMLRWTGQAFEKLPIGLPEGEGDISLVFGTDPAHLWVADSGRIFRYKP